MKNTQFEKKNSYQLPLFFELFFAIKSLSKANIATLQGLKWLYM